MQLTLFAKRAFASGPAKALANGTLDCVQKLFVDLQHKLHVSTFWGKVGPILFWLVGLLIGKERRCETHL